MRSKLAVAAFAVAASALPMQQAHAVIGCGGTEFLMCANWTLTSLGGNSYTFTITNTSNLAPALNPNSAFTSIGLGTSTSGISVLSFTGSDGWTLQNGAGNPFNGQGMINIVFNATSAQGINGALNPGDPALVFNFTLSGGTLTQVGIHDNGGLGCSSKAVFDIASGAVASGTSSTAPSGGVCGGTEIPEPSTYILLGTGMLGILVARRRFRIKEG